MNDFIEFVTWPTHLNLFHRIRTQALVFYIKGQESVAIGLSARSGKDCRYWIVLEEGDCQMLKHGKQVRTSLTQNILSESEYRRFWISWYGNVLKLGQNENASAILSRKIKKMNLKYVTFAVVGETNELFWKCHIPEPIKNITLAKCNEGKAYWVKVDNQLPDDVVIGGFENEPLYIVRSRHRSSLTPGKFVPSKGMDIFHGEELHILHQERILKNVTRTYFEGCYSDAICGFNFQALCGYNMIWEKTIGDKIPSGSVKGGYSEVNHEILYIGRAYHNGHVIPGKVQPSHNVCCFSYEDKEEYSPKYEILVYPHPCPSAGDHYVTCFGNTNNDGKSSTSNSTVEVQ